MSQPSAQPIRWFVAGDLNGFFSLMFDNMTVLSYLAGILLAVGYPAKIIFTRMFPGTAFGVLFGDLVYTWMAARLIKRTGNTEITAMPLGLDTPSTIGIALTVLVPAFEQFKQRYSVDQAALHAWYVGMAVMVLIGIFKIFFSFFGGWIQRIVPQAGLLGSLAGIGLALLGFLPLLDIFGLPLVGMVSLGIILYNLVAGIRLPRNLPGVLVAICAGTVVYYIMAPLGLLGGGHYTPLPSKALPMGLPVPTWLFVHGLREALNYLPIALPFAILTVVGGINVTESARVAGDEFNTRDVLLTEAVATLVAGLCGGVAQSTPYIGQPAYKAMGSRLGYTILTALFVGLGGILGYVSFLVELVPRAVLAPILVFVALDIMVQAFVACPRRHAPAVAFSYFPSVAQLMAIKYTTPTIIPAAHLQKLLTQAGTTPLPEALVTVSLANGFILTAMLWGAVVACLIDRRLRRACVYLLVLAGLAFFGVIHSPIPGGAMALPWHLTPLQARVAYQFTEGYLVLAVLMFGLSFTSGAREPCPEGDLVPGH